MMSKEWDVLHCSQKLVICRWRQPVITGKPDSVLSFGVSQGFLSNQKCLQILPNVPWHAQSPWLRTCSLNREQWQCGNRQSQLHLQRLEWEPCQLCGRDDIYLPWMMMSFCIMETEGWPAAWWEQHAQGHRKSSKEPRVSRERWIAYGSIGF